MALCLATSLIEKHGFDPKDQMDRYCRWRKEGYLSSTGRCFDIGNTTQAALRKYLDTGNPFSGSTHPGASGNGSLMRLAPVPMFFYPDRELVIRYSAESSRTTHGSAECLDACRALGDMLCRALGARSASNLNG
jgi:ADP-ribosyl-[dinitrogen reductase] hydrolase